jgi:long-subunit acyl-CoA synthetase (AMP-forming)
MSFIETVDHLRKFEPDENWYMSQSDDLAVLFLTSGSTGVSKGVMLTHRNILSNVCANA